MNQFESLLIRSLISELNNDATFLHCSVTQKLAGLLFSACDYVLRVNRGVICFQQDPVKCFVMLMLDSYLHAILVLDCFALGSKYLL